MEEKIKCPECDDEVGTLYRLAMHLGVKHRDKVLGLFGFEPEEPDELGLRPLYKEASEIIGEDITKPQAIIIEAGEKDEESKDEPEEPEFQELKFKTDVKTKTICNQITHGIPKPKESQPEEVEVSGSGLPPPVPPPETVKLKEAFLELTSKCNLRCKHCYSWSRNSELSLKEIEAILYTLFEEGIKKVVLLGGEPMLHSGIEQVLDYAQKAFEQVTIQSNLHLLSFVKVLNKFPKVQVVCSLEDLSEKNDIIRDGGSFFQTMQNFLRLKNKKGIRTTVFPDTDVEQILKIMAELNKMGHKFGITFVPFIPAGKAKNLWKKIPTSEKMQYAHGLVETYDHRYGHNKNLYRIDQPQSFIFDKGLREKFIDTFIERKRVCAAGCHRIHITSTPKGMIYPCPFLQQFPMGSFFTRDSYDEKGNIKYKKVIDNFLKAKDRLEQFNEMIKAIPPGGHCAECHFSQICGSGCIAYYFDTAKIKIKEGHYEIHGFRDNPHCPIWERRRLLSHNAIAKNGISQDKIKVMR